MQPYGEGCRRILLVGEAPGKNEDEQGRPFIGEAGQYLRETLYDAGLDEVDRDCKITNALICRPKDNKLPSDPKPLLEACRPNLMKTIKDFQPHVIILLGGTACKSLLPVLWKDDIGQVGIWGSWRIPSQEINAWVCPTFHPAYLLRNPGPVIELKFKEDIKNALKLKGRPWKEVPDYASYVKCIFRPSEAAADIRKIVSDAECNNVPIAVDYETTCLKPEYEGAEIICCSMSNGRQTIAYPWAGEAIEATSQAWRSPVRKIASNLKFEDRWTRYFLKHGITHWYWDTMLAAHILDNREGICSVKFQAFVLLGLKSHNDHIEPLLDCKGTKHINRIRELDMKDLLVYNGMDALVEWLVAKKQIQLMKRRIDDYR